MNGPYRTPLPSLTEMLDELVKADRTRDEACAELRNMIRDGAVTLLDCHQPPQSSEWLIGGAILVLDAYQQMLDAHRQRKRPAGFGALPDGYPDYFGDGVFGVRAQFEKAAGFKADIEPDIPAKNLRFPDDDRLVCEAVRGLKSRRWPNKHRAAIELAKHAKGISEPAIISRLETKISKQLKTTRKTD
jgi:hypothetical protein